MNYSTDSNETVTTNPSNGGFPPILIFFISMQQIFFVFSCSGNGLVIFIFVKYLKLKSLTNRFVISLAVADFFTGISSFSQIFYFLYPGLSKHMMTCFMRYQVIALMVLVSVVTVTFTTFDRFIAICFPHNYLKLMTGKTANCLIITAWVYSFLLSQFPYTGLNRWKATEPCIYSAIFVKAMYGIAAVTIWLFSIVTFVLYLFIIRRAWRYFKRVKPSVNIAVSDQSKDRNRRTEKDVRIAKVMGVVTVAFTVCWVPYSICQFRYSLPGKYYAAECDWFVFLGLFNSIMNPFIYAVHRRDFNTACRKLFRCMKTENNRNVIEVSSNVTETRPGW